ncbi:receptor-type tyrosine-protein phosphatase H-like isoform X2 [Clavelina lepadiformis]|uniref:receptor-type tyrosine-protein phosphatase H-like isoform X2 n=1 Tax=Clavelina lepadiformis TaxID=159417 RepID=UPI00404132B9
MLFKLFVCLLYISIANAAVSAPTGLDSTSIRSNSFTLTWDESADLDYQVTVQLSSVTTDPTTPSGATVSSGVTIMQTTSGADIQPNTNYDVFLFAVSQTDSSDFAIAAPLTRLTTASNAPTISGITTVGSDRFTVNWDYTNPAAGLQQATEYRVTYSDGSGSKQTEPVANIDTKMLQITGLTSNTDYSVTVLAWKDDVISTDDSALSLVATFDKPTGLSTTAVTSTSIEISWSAPDTTGGGSATIDGYVVSWTPASSDGSSTKDVTGTSATIDSLQANTDYSITVAAKSTNNGVGAVSDALSATTGIGKPTGLTVGDTSSSTIQVTWSAPSGGNAVAITGYVLTWTPPTGAGSMVATTDLSSPTTISGLNSNTEYSIQVTATSGSGNGDVSDAVKGTTGIGKPTGLTVGDTSSSTIQVTWSAPSGGNAVAISGYELAWTSATGAGSMMATTDGSTPTTISGLNSNTEYNIRVTATTSGSGNGDMSDAVKGTTVSDKVITPTSTASTSTSISLQWDAVGGSGSVTYTVEWDPASSDGTTSSKPNIDGTSTTIDGLSSNTGYTFTIKAVNAGGTGEASNSVQFFTVPGIASMISVTLAADRTTKAVVSFNLPTNGADNYQATFATSGESDKIFTSTISPINADGLTPGQSYDVTVRARNTAGFGEESSSSITMAPNPVTGLSATKLTDEYIVIRWTLPSSAASAIYDRQLIKYNEEGNVAQLEIRIDGTTSTSYNITGLTSGVNYIIKVFSVSNDILSDVASISQATANTGPSNIRIVNQTTTSIEISWSPPFAEVQFDSYLLSYVVVGDTASEVDKIIAKTITSFVISPLDPGTLYRISVRSVGEATSDPVTEDIPTVPDVVKNLDAIQSNGNPTTQLDVTWNKPSGRGERINISYVGLSIASMNEMSVGFNDTTATLSVIPGNTYNITVSVISNELQSDSMVKMNAKPAQPLDLVSVPAIDNINVTWTPSDGFIQKYVVVALSNAIEQHRMDISKDDASHVIPNLSSYTDYNISIYSIIVDVAGSDQESEHSLISDRTLAAAPPPPPADAAEGFSSGQATTTSYTFVLPADTFSSDNGPIQYYAVFRTTSLDGEAPNVNGPLEPCDKAGVTECVAMWTDELGNPATVQSGRRKRQAGNEQISFTLGSGEMTQSPYRDDVTYTNLALDPNTGYRVAVAAKTGNDELTVTQWSPVVQTAATSNTVTVVIAVVVPVVVIIGLAIIAVWFYRRRSQTKNRPNQQKLNVVDSVKDKELKRNIPLSKFLTHIRNVSQPNLYKEFQNISFSHPDFSNSVGKLSQNDEKNRCQNILPYNRNRVKITTIFGEEGSDYINASYIHMSTNEKKFIATQGPLPNTMDDFWRMIWEQECLYIVMLGKLVIKGEVACNQYWPSHNEPTTAHGVTLHLVAEKENDWWTSRELIVKRNRSERKLKQFHFTSWDNDDEFERKNIQALIRFIAEVRKEVDASESSSPIVVHCSNGSGRSGTFIALDRLLQEMQEKSSVNIFETVQQLRQDRMAMVENFKQYLVLYKGVECVLNHMYDEVLPNNSYVNDHVKNDSDQVIYETIPELYEEYDLSNV